MRLVAHPGEIFINGVNETGIYSQNHPVLSNGAPLMSNFILKIPSIQINQDLCLVFQFGGEKSPSKLSTYKINLIGHRAIGIVEDESIYIT
jgi:hypothetical protein